MDLTQARKEIAEAIHHQDLLMVIGDCHVEYQGRAASKLPLGKRLCLIKGDGSFGIHQNRKLRPVNYMMNAALASEVKEGLLVITARKPKPKEEIKAYFHTVEGLHRYAMDDPSDLMLVGSERELSAQLMNDLSFIEEGLKPIKSEVPSRNGTMDIVGEDAQGRLVVIEVKRRQADFDAVTQLERYMKKVAKMKGRETRGILVAPGISRNALELLEQYGLEYYKFEFDVDQPRVSIKGVQKKQPTLKEFISHSK